MASYALAVPVIQVHQSQIHYEERGKGTPVVLIHGFPLDGRIYDDQLEPLAERHRVIVPDLPGFGQSATDADFTCESLADELDAFLRLINAVPCVLGGLSMGGYVALPFAKKYAGDLKGLILIDTRAEADPPEGKAAREKMLESLKTGGVKAVAQQMFPRLIAQATAHQQPKVGERLRQIMQSQKEPTLRRAIIAMRDRQDFTRHLPSIETPTLILVGEFDSITPPAMSEKMHKAMPKSWMTVIEGSGHLATMEKPDPTNDAILKFLEELEQS